MAETNLTETNLTETNLTETNLTETNLTETNLTETNLPPVSAQDRYIASLDDIDKMCLEIAKSHLKSSFSLEKSIGFKKFIK